jgi:hypothetical protein
MIRTILSAVLAGTTLSSSAFAQLPLPLPLPLPINTRGTPEDQRACHNDANKLCRSVIGDDMAVLQCFQSQRAKLSAPCRQVLQKYGQ